MATKTQINVTIPRVGSSLYKKVMATPITMAVKESTKKVPEGINNSAASKKRPKTMRTYAKISDLDGSMIDPPNFRMQIADCGLQITE